MTRHQPIASALIAAAVIACFRAGEPSPTIRVDVTTEVSGYRIFVDDGSAWPLAQCRVRLTANAVGVGSATFEGAKFRWFWGVDRANAVDSVTYTAAEVKEHWGTLQIAANTGLPALWTVSSPYPFEVELTYRYRGERASASADAVSRFACGPKPPATTPDPPAVLDLSLAPAGGVREPGDTLTVTYEAVNGSGLWATAVATAQAFSGDTVVAEHMAPSVRRTVRRPIPANVNMGVRGVVGAFAFDAFGQYTTATTTFDALGDETPPTIDVAMFARPWGTMTANLGGRYFIGDSVHLFVTARDNHRVQSVVWYATPGSYRDSAIVEAPSYGNNFLKLRVLPEWRDGMQLHFFARDAAGLTSPVRSSQSGAFTIFPTVTRPNWSVRIGAWIDEVVMDMTRNVLYLRRINEPGIDVLSLATRRIVRTIPVRAVGMDMTPGGDSLVLSLGGLPSERALGIIDLRQAEPSVTIVPVPSLDTALRQHLHGVRVAKNSKAFVNLAGNSPAAFRLLEFDLRTSQQRLRTDGQDGGLAAGITRSIDHSVLIVQRSSCIQRYDSATDSFGACGVIIPRGVLPSSDRTGQRFGNSLSVYDANLAFVRQVESVYDLSGHSVVAIIDPRGEFLYHYLRGVGILRSRVSDGALLDRTLMPDVDFVSSMRPSPDGKTLILLESGSSFSRVVVVDLTTSAAPAHQESARSAAPAHQDNARSAAPAHGRMKPAQPTLPPPAIPRGGARLHPH